MSPDYETRTSRWWPGTGEPGLDRDDLGHVLNLAGQLRMPNSVLQHVGPNFEAHAEGSVSGWSLMQIPVAEAEVERPLYGSAGRQGSRAIVVSALGIQAVVLRLLGLDEVVPDQVQALLERPPLDLAATSGAVLDRVLWF